MNINSDLDVINIGELYKVSDTGSPRKGRQQQSNANKVSDAVISIRNGRIVAVGTRSEVEISGNAPVLNVEGAVVSPGLVESHAHPIYAGNRSHEYTKRLQGLSASIIGKNEESGIKFSVRKTKAASAEALTASAKDFLDKALSSGVTTCEVKAGYGLTFEEELRHLTIAYSLRDHHPLRIQPTFAAGHDVPIGVNAEDHINDIIQVMLPEIAKKHPETLNDITCENGIFTPEQAERVMRAATQNGLRNIVHADAFSDSGGWEVAVRNRALSAHHLTYTPKQSILQNRNTETVATILPIAELIYMTDVRAPARTFIENDVPVAVATDYCSSIGATSLMRTMLMAAPWFAMDPSETLVASTLNAAYALGVNKTCGSIDVGKSGDLVIYQENTLDDVFWSEPAEPVIVRAGKVLRRNRG